MHSPFRKSSPAAHVLIGTASVALLAACTKNTGADAGARADGTTAKPAMVALVNDAQGPSAEVPGAKPGGTITVYYLADFEHLDPARNYVSDASVTGMLIYRTLTAQREKPSGGFDIVGDLATNTGVTTDSGKTWTYTLRDSVTYEDGRPITAQDVAFGIARTFSPELTDGAKYIQQWLADDLDYNKQYKGPYNGGAPLPPNVTTPDAKTIVFHFKTAHPDLPFALAMPTSSPVPKDKDERTRYDNHPFASGPYKIGTYRRGEQLVLVKNTAWKASSDPVRHQYPDSIVFEFRKTALQFNEQLIADQGADAMAISWVAVPPEDLPRVLADPKTRARVIEGVSQYTRYLAINNQRVKDVAVRQALNYAIDRENFLKVYGPMAAEPSTTILTPPTVGYQNYTAYDGGPNGNVSKAKELLGGKTVPLVYAYANSPRQQKIGAFIKSNLEQAGFQVTLQPVDPAQYYATVGKKKNPFDIYMCGWGFDWPSGSSVIPPTLDGRTITAEGNQNCAYFDSPEVNAKIDQIMKDPDLVRAGTEWAALDKQIMEQYAPIVPLTYERWFALTGSRVGGAYLSPAYGVTALNNVFVK